MNKSTAKKRLKKGFDQGKEVRAIARERVGTVKPSRIIAEKPDPPKISRGAKHKKPLEPDQWDNE